MKFRMKKSLRTIVLLAAAMVVIILAFALSNEMTAGETVEEKVQIYGYSQKASIDYQVLLKPNMLYEESSIGKGATYITSYIDDIEATLTYRFLGERESEFWGDYEIVAVVEGYTGSGEDYKTIWEKDFVLLEKTPFEGRGRSMVIEETILLNYFSFNDFAEQLSEDTGIRSNAKVNLLWKLNIEAETDSGSIVEQLVPFAVIALEDEYFQIYGQLDMENTGGIDQVQQVAVPPDSGLVTAYGVGIGFSAIALLLILVFTRAGDVSPVERKLKWIFKKHGARLAALNGEVEVDERRCSAVKTIDDLVKIADELGRPITYKYNVDFSEINRFYVFDENKTYLYDVGMDIIFEGESEVLETSESEAGDL